MGNCLVTKLKETVNNSELIRLGCFRVNKLKVQSEFVSVYNLLLGVVTNSSLTGYTDDSEFLDSSGNSLGNEIQINNNNNRIYLGLPASTYEIGNKDLITSINTLYASTEMEIPISTMKKMTRLVTVSAPLCGDLKDIDDWNSIQTLDITGNCKVKGDISELTKCPNLAVFKVKNASDTYDLHGNIKELGVLGKLNTLHFKGGYYNVEGDIESYVALRFLGGKTSMSGHSILIFGPRIDYKGSRISSNSEKTMVWTSDGNNVTISITGLGDTTISVNQDGTWTRVS